MIKWGLLVNKTNYSILMGTKGKQIDWPCRTTKSSGMGLGEMQGMSFVLKTGKLENRGVFDQFE